jgi:actin-related protein 5
MLKDVFVTGGYSQVPNFDARLTAELRSLLPAGSPLQVRSAAHPETDAWMGMAKWSKTDDYKNSRVTRAMYEEMGPDYIKEHAFGNSSYL